MRVSLIQPAVEASESADARRRRLAEQVRGRSGDDLVVLPELWAAGAWAYDRWDQDAEPLDGPTAEAMSAAARHAGTWLHAGSIVERDPDGTLYNTALLFVRRTARSLPQDPPVRLRHRRGDPDGRRP